MKLKNKSIVALSLVLSMALSISANALNYGYVLDDLISHGTTYYSTLGQSDKGPQKVSYIDYKPNTNTSPVVVYGNKLYGKSTFDQAAKFLQNQGMNVVAGINADYFVVSTGIPLGIVINDGALMSSDAWQNAVGFKADGSAIIGKPGASISMSNETANVNIDYFNKTRSTSGVYLLDSNFSGTTKTTTEGTSIVFAREDMTPFKLGGNVSLIVQDIIKGSSALNIGDNEFVLTIDAKGPIAKLPAFKIGDIVTLKSTVNNKDWENVLYATGAKETLIENGLMNTTLDNKTTHPRSAVGVRADGAVILYEADGRQKDVSLGLTLKELAFELAALGCVSAINLDGGGSSIFGVKKPSDTSLSIVNTPSEGTQRPSANFIMLVNTTQPTGIIGNISIHPDSHYLLAGGKTLITTKASDTNFYPMTPPAYKDIDYRIDNETSYINNGEFFAVKQGTATITAKYQDTTVTDKIFIFDTIDNIKLSADGKDITTISVSSGKSIDLSASVSYQNVNITSTDDLLRWEVVGDVGTITKDGVFTSNGKAGDGKVIVSYGTYKKEIPVSIGIAPMINVTPIIDFENAQPFTSNAEISIDTNLQYVSNGFKSLKIAHQANEDIYLTTPDITISPIFKSMILSVYGDNSDAKLTGEFKLNDGSNVSLEFGNIDFNGYKTLLVGLPENINSFTGLKLSGGKKGIIYIDQIAKNELLTIDKVAPTIDIVEAPSYGETTTTSIVKVKILDDNKSTSVNDNYIKTFLNDEPISFANNKSDGTVTITVPALTNELNRLTIYASDGSGNENRLALDIPLASPTPSVFSDTGGHWADSYITFANTNKLVQGSSKGAGLVFRPNENLTRAEFAVIMSRFLKLDTTVPETDDKVIVVGEENVNSFLPFDDKTKIPSWSLGAVNAVYKAGIMTGSSTNGKLNFNPNASITRAEVIAVIGRTFPKGYATNALSFIDNDKVPAWAIEHTELLIALDILDGYPDNTIKPANNIKRGEIAKLLYNLY